MPLRLFPWPIPYPICQTALAMPQVGVQAQRPTQSRGEVPHQLSPHHSTINYFCFNYALQKGAVLSIFYSTCVWVTLPMNSFCSNGGNSTKHVWLKGALGLADLRTINLQYLGSTISLRIRGHFRRFYPQSPFLWMHYVDLPHFCTCGSKVICRVSLLRGFSDVK